MLTDAETEAAMLRHTQNAVARVEHAIGLDTPTVSQRRSMLLRSLDHLRYAQGMVADATDGLTLHSRRQFNIDVAGADACIQEMLGDLNRGQKKEPTA